MEELQPSEMPLCVLTHRAFHENSKSDPFLTGINAEALLHSLGGGATQAGYGGALFLTGTPNFHLIPFLKM